MTALHTIGYEGASVEDLVTTLERAGVEHVVDVRELPQSRRPGFSKTSLAGALDRVGIGYRHVRQLGDPKEGREAARRGDDATFRAIFAAHLESDASKAALDEIAAFVVQNRAALLCYERDPKHCHRTIVAQHLARRAMISIMHLGVAQRPRSRGEAGAESVGRYARAS